MNTQSLTTKRIQLITWTLLCLNPIIGMAVDLVAPSLPAITISLQASHSLTKNIIAIYIFGYALGNFFMGFVTDAFGRKIFIRLSLFAFLMVSLIPVFFPNIYVLLIARCLQGLTLGSVAVLVRSIFADVLTSEQLLRIGPLMGTMWGIGPVIGPIIGGYLQFYFGWQAGFVLFAILALGGLIAILLIVPETISKKYHFDLKTIKVNLSEVLRHRLFIGIAILMGLTYSLIITFNTLGPFFIQIVLHYTPVFFGHLALCLGLVFLVSTFISRYLLKKHEVEKLYLVGVYLLLFIATIGLLISYFLPHNLSLFATISALMFFACGWIFPMSMGKGMSLFRHIAGTAAASMYLINMVITSLTSFLVSFIKVQNEISIMLVYFLLMLLCLVIYLSMIRSKT